MEVKKHTSPRHFPYMWRVYPFQQLIHRPTSFILAFASTFAEQLDQLLFSLQPMRDVLSYERLTIFHDRSVARIQLCELRVGSSIIIIIIEIAEKKLQGRYVLRQILKYGCSVAKDRVECEERLVFLVIETD